MNKCNKCGEQIMSFSGICQICGLDNKPSPTDQRLDRIECAIRHIANTLDIYERVEVKQRMGSSCPNSCPNLDDINKILGGEI